jgi:hypothetical protein
MAKTKIDETKDVVFSWDKDTAEQWLERELTDAQWEKLKVPFRKEISDMLDLLGTAEIMQEVAERVL